MKKQIQKIIAIILIIFTILTMQGFAYSVSAISREIASNNKKDLEYAEQQENIIDVAGTDKESNGIIESSYYDYEIWKNRYKEYETVNTGNNSEKQVRTRTNTTPDMAMYLKRYKYNNDTSYGNVDLTTGELNTSFNLAHLKGNNGIDLDLTITYSTEEGRAGEVTWSTSTGSHVYYALTYNACEEINTEAYVYVHYVKHTFETQAELSAYLNNETFGNVYSDGIYIFWDNCIVETGEEILPVLSYSPREENVRRNGLGLGWVFNIPNIETLTYVNLETGLEDTSEQILKLDNGNRYNLKYGNFTYLRTGDISINDVNIIVNNKTAVKLVTLKEGIKYYFDSNGLCLRKEDKYGNGINYTYTGTGTSAKISSISDDYGRTINLTYNYNSVVVTSNDTVVATISVTTVGTRYLFETVTGITYNNTETYSFDYEQADAYVDLGESNFDYEAYLLLNEVGHPNGDKNVYDYELVNTPWGESGNKEIPMVIASKEKIGNTYENVRSYTRTGNSYTSYFQRINGSSADNYTVTVSEGTREKVFTYNINDLLVSESYGYQITEYEYTNNLATKVETKDYGSSSSGSYVSTINQYTYDNKGNKLTHTDPDNIVTTYTYDGTYSMLTRETRLGEDAIYVLSNDKKSVVEYRYEKNNVVYDKETYTYDNKGNILSKTKYIYPGGTNTIVTNYSYTDNIVNRPISLTGLYNTGISVSDTTYTTNTKYDIAGRVISETDGNGNEISYTYDNLGRLTRKDYEDGTYETWTYNLSENSSTHTDRVGYVTKTYYDINNNEKSIYELNGNTETKLKENSYSYKLLIRETNALGTYIQYSYDSRDRLTHLRIYDVGNVLKYTESYSYSISSGNLKNTKTVLGNNTYSPSEVTIEYINNKGEKVKEGGVRNNSEVLKTYTYDNKGNLIRETDANNHVTEYTYDIYGNVIVVEDALGNQSTNTYDNLGNLTSTTDANNNTSTFVYDKLGRKTSQIVPVDGNTYKQTSTFSYDDNGNLTQEQVQVNAPGLTNAYSKTINTYDSNNNLIETKMYDGTTVVTDIEYTYTPYGNVLTEEVNNLVVQTNIYNTRGELTQTTDANNLSEVYTYNLLGQVTSKTDRNGTTFTYTYDVLGNVIIELASKSNNPSQTISYTYTPTNRVRSINNGTTIITREYDSLGRMIKETDYDGTDGFELEYVYDNNGNVVHLTETLNNEVVKEEYYTYTALNQLLSVGYYEETILPPEPEPQYDANSIIDVNGNQVFTYSSTYTSGSYGIGIYNQNNVQTGTVYITPANNQTYVSIQGSLIQDSSGEYVGGTITFTDANETRTYYFDDFATGNVDGSIEEGVLIGYYITDVDGYRAYTVFVDEDPFSNDYCAWITSTIYDGSTYNGGMRNTFNQEDGRARNRDNNLVWQDAGIYVTYTYDNNGNVISASYNNGTSTIYTYTEGNLVKSIENKKGNVVLSSYAYTYYLSGNVKSKTENTGKVTNYVYDRLGRLTSEVSTIGNQTDTYTYSYDGRGNRTQLVHNGITTYYTYYANNRLYTEISGTQVTVYNYDGNGNTVSVLVNNNIASTYNYDLYSRQTSYISGNNISTTYYSYRGDGLRHSKGNLKQYWDGENISLEKNGNNIIKYYRGITLIFKDDGNTKTYYLYNGHLDVVNLTDESGNKTKTYEYDAFGVEIDIDSYDTNAFRYCGEYYDKESKNIYLRARYYTSATGRFTQEDPIKDGYNWYVYCSNNPVNLVDPSGLFDWGKALTIAAIVLVTVVTVAAVVATAGAAAAAVGMAAGIAATTMGVTAATASAITTTATICAAAGAGAIIGAEIAIGTSDIVEVATDGYNPIRDELLDGNQESYDLVKAGTTLGTAGIIQLGIDNMSLNYKEEVIIEDKKEPIVSNEKSIHGNSLECNKVNYGYMLEDENGKLLKYGESIHREKRYTNKFYVTNNYHMVVLVEGNKKDVHIWQHQMIVDYYNKNGELPPLNKSFW